MDTINHRKTEAEAYLILNTMQFLTASSENNISFAPFPIRSDGTGVNIYQNKGG